MMKIVDYVHAALKDNVEFCQLGLDQQGELCVSITNQLQRNFPSAGEIYNCIFSAFKEFSEVINACITHEIKNM